MWVASKLFQKEGHAGSYALIAKISKPQFLGRARTSLAFTSSNQPVNTGQIDFVERTKQRLGANEPHRGGHAP